MLQYVCEKIKDTELAIRVIDILLYHGARTEDILLQIDNLEIAKHLISCGADVNFENILGKTPLIASILRQNFDMANLFLKNGADTSSLNKYRDGQYYLMHTLTKREMARAIGFMVKLKSVNVDITTENTRRTPLYYAAKRCHLGMVRMLVKAGSNINIEDKPRDDRYPFSPLEYTVRCTKDLEVLKALAASKFFDANIVLRDPYVPFKFLEYLWHDNIDIDRQDKGSCRTMIHHAASVGNRKVFDFLLKKGARTDIKDKYGQTADDYFNDRIVKNDSTARIIIL